MMMMMMMMINGYTCQLMRPQRHNVKDDMTTFEELHFKEPTLEPTMKSLCHAVRKYFLMNVAKQREAGLLQPAFSTTISGM